jgi:LuxR family maltose regulon positive regulatory protein
MLVEALGWASSESAIAPFLEFHGEIRELLEALGAARLLEQGPSDGFFETLRMKLAAGPQLRRVYGLLTKRETEILGLLRQSASNKHIARAADITEDAVKFHLKNVYRKLGVHSRSEALKALDDGHYA